MVQKVTLKACGCSLLSPINVQFSVV